LNQYKKKGFKQEDVGMVHSALSNFDRYKKKLDKKDIGQYKNVAAVQDAVQPHLGTAATKKEAAKEIEQKGRTLIHDDGAGLKVYRLEKSEEGKKASQDIYGGGYKLGGTHTSWCTAARSEDCMFDDYQNHHLHTIHTPSGNVYQANVDDGELVDAKNEPVDLGNPDIPHISKALKYIPKGGVVKVHHGFSDVSSDDITLGMDSDDSSVRRSAITHKNANVDHIHKALRDEDNAVRMSAVHHSKFNATHIDQVLAGKHTSTKLEVMKHKDFNEDHIAKILDVPSEKMDMSVVNAALKHPKFNIDALLKHKNKEVRTAAISNYEKVLPRHITKALDDPDEDVRVYALEAPGLNARHITKALNDPNPFVSRIAQTIAKRRGIIGGSNG
jgi:hypothetical protein